jgi:hypothetical protein
MTPRRTFIEVREIPGLVRGALWGEARALRRILGGRRAGRYGVALVLAAGLVAAPLADLATLALAYLGLGCIAWLARRREPALRLRDALRLALWTAAPLVAATVPLRFLWPGSPVPALVALALAYALVLRGYARIGGRRSDQGNAASS